MSTHLSVKSYSLSDFSGFKPSFDRLLSLLHRSLFIGLLISLIWLSGLSRPALAMPIAAPMTERIASGVVNSAVESDRMIALITCLPKQLSQPSLKRSLNEMGNEQLERAFNLKTNPKLSQAEIDLASCLNHQKS